MSVQYHCPHLDAPRAPLPPSYPSSSSSLTPLASLYFCEECDAVRCDACVAVEVASYYCPNCLFDVPGANVRADRNRCARSCFACPQCATALATLASNPVEPSTDAAAATTGAPYFLACPACKWSSREVGVEFDKPTGLASQLAKMLKETQATQAEFDALKDHLESFLAASSVPGPGPASRAARQPSRHISQLTQAAARALHRNVPGMAAASRLPRKARADDRDERAGWDEAEVYESKRMWRDADDEYDPETNGAGAAVARLDRRWDQSWNAGRLAKSQMPRRIQLQAKLTKRCPHAACRHLLIQPDTKSVRMKIKMVAANYLPTIEIGRRQRRVGEGISEGLSEDEKERRRRERRRTRGATVDDDEDMDMPLSPGEVYTFQVAFTNPLYDPIQIRLAPAHQAKPLVAPAHHIVVPTPHFTVDALKDAWAIDDDAADDDDDDAGAGASATALVSLGRRARPSTIGAGSMRERRGKESGVEKRANTSKVALELELGPHATGQVQADFEVRYTYRADEGARDEGARDEGASAYKTFTFWVRADFGTVA
ncbi:hypothetical protein Q5752_004194 [Cryptotrichosporon argae]